MSSQPILIPVNDREFVLTQDYIYEWEADGKRYRVVVLAGFVTDVASVPRIFWTLTGFTPDGLHRGAAVIHDLLYQWRGLPDVPAGYIQTLEQGKWVAFNQRWSRKDADRLFCRIMGEAGTSATKRRLMFWAVRLFGGLAWDR